MKISYGEMNRIKQYNLPRLMLDFGVRCASDQNGSYSFHCPFHTDSNPSLKVNLKGTKWLWHCFSCNLGGNVINFVMRYENLSILEACHKLIKLNGRYLNEKPETRIQRPKGVPRSEASPKGDEREGKPEKEELSTEAQKLLNRVVEFYHSCLYDDKRALNYLTNKRHIHDKKIFKIFKIGFANGTLHKALPQKGEVVEQLRELGILTKRGKEHFLDCCIFPIFDEKGNCVEIYGRRITAQEPKHLYLKGAHKGVFNYCAAKTNSTIILTEGIIDCLSIYLAGFKNCIPLYGTNGLTQDHIELFKKTNTKEIYLCLDSDNAGKRACQNLKNTLTGFGFTTHIIELPEGIDPNEYFKHHQASDFEKLLDKANPKDGERSEINIKESEESIETFKDGFSIQYAERTYFIRGIDHSHHQKLRVNIKAITERRFHIDTVDLYIAKQRKSFAKEASILFREEQGLIEHDLNRIIEKIEAYVQGQSELTPRPYIIPDKEKEAALKFLKHPNLINQILTDFELIGCTGEGMNKLTGYLAAVSRKLDDPLSILILSRSAAGKSLLQEAILSLVPDEDKTKYTRITGQALFYKGENSLVHKVLAIEEEEGANEAAYSIRTMQSSKLLSIATTIKDPLTGQMKTQEYKVRGPLSIILTTSRTDIDYETMNRFILLSIDESKAQTRLIHKLQREKDTLKGLLQDEDKQCVIKKHHNAQRLLRPLKVVNPYAHLLTFQDERLRARRDHKKYLNLIKAVAFLFQYQRPLREIEHKQRTISYIEVTLDDIALANTIAHEILGRSLDELAPPSRKLLFLIKEMVEELAKKEQKRCEDVRFTRRDIRQYTKWSDHQLRAYLRQLVDLEYVLITSGRNGLRFIYKLIYESGGKDGSAFFMGLIDIENLKEKANLAPKSSNLAPSLRPACSHLVGEQQMSLL